MEMNLEQKVADLEQKLQELQAENHARKKENESMVKLIRELYSINSQTMNEMSTIVANLNTLDVKQLLNWATINNFKYEILDPAIRREEHYYPLIRNVNETLEEIIKGKKSIARFGDGEFAQISKMERHKFQKLNDTLAVRLEEVLHSRHPRMLIAIANNYGSLEAYTESAANAIRLYMMGENVRERQMELLEHDRVYYDAYVSRPYVMFKDNQTDAPKKRFEAIKEIWRERSVIIVEGAQTRIGVGNHLLEGAREIKRILAPATSSFDRYDDILKASLAHAESDTLFLIAMGPSAGVLAYDLTVEGYQAIDIGHLDLEYEWFLAGKGERVAVKYKYNNEVEGDEGAEELNDPVYEAQIIADLSDYQD